MLVLGQKSEAVIEKAVLEFVTKHGLLGLMTALPSSPDFMDYEVTFLPKNRFIQERSMKTDAYQKLFFPFHDLQKMRTKLETQLILCSTKGITRIVELHNAATVLFVPH